jgi:HPt (histidine-containing phosphotransfer) domain-containing protein
MDGYVSKPIRAELLRAEIERVIKFYRSRSLQPEVANMHKQNYKSLDREELLNRVEHDEELAREILSIFQTDTAARRAALRQAVESRNAAEVRAAAHAFKGMLANLAATPASLAAAHLEMLAKEEKSEDLAQAWQAFERELEGVLLEVEHLLAGALQ